MKNWLSKYKNSGELSKENVLCPPGHYYNDSLKECVPFSYMSTYFNNLPSTGMKRQNPYFKDFDVNLPQYNQPPKGFFTGFGFSENVAPSVDVHGIGAYGERSVSDRLKLTGSATSPSVVYPGGNQLFMKPNINLGFKYKFDNGGDISLPNVYPNQMVPKFNDGGEPCPPKHVRINGKCISIYSEEYKTLYPQYKKDYEERYNQGKLSRTSKLILNKKDNKYQWIPAQPGEEGAVTSVLLPPVTVTAKQNKYMDAARKKALKDVGTLEDYRKRRVKEYPAYYKPGYVHYNPDKDYKDQEAEYDKLYNKAVYQNVLDAIPQEEGEGRIAYQNKLNELAGKNTAAAAQQYGLNEPFEPGILEKLDNWAMGMSAVDPGIGDEKSYALRQDPFVPLEVIDDLAYNYIFEPAFVNKNGSNRYVGRSEADKILTGIFNPIYWGPGLFLKGASALRGLNIASKIGKATEAASEVANLISKTGEVADVAGETANAVSKIGETGNIPLVTRQDIIANFPKDHAIFTEGPFGTAVRNRGGISYDDAIDLIHKTVTENPELAYGNYPTHFHGSSSASLPGFFQKQGLNPLGQLLKQGEAPLTGEIVFGGLDANKDLISTTFLKNLDDPVRYTRQGKFVNPELKLKQWNETGRNEWLTKYPEDIERVKLLDNVYTNRVKTWQNMTDAEKQIAQENFPVLYGIKPNSKFSSGIDRFGLIKSDIDYEMGIRGLIPHEEIPSIFVPKSKIDDVSKFIGNDKIHVLPIDDLIKKSYRGVTPDWYKWKQGGWINKYKQGGLVKAQNGGEPCPDGQIRVNGQCMSKAEAEALRERAYNKGLDFQEDPKNPGDFVIIEELPTVNVQSKPKHTYSDKTINLGDGIGFNYLADKTGRPVTNTWDFTIPAKGQLAAQRQKWKKYLPDIYDKPLYKPFPFRTNIYGDLVLAEEQPQLKSSDPEPEFLTPEQKERKKYAEAYYGKPEQISDWDLALKAYDQHTNSKEVEEAARDLRYQYLNNVELNPNSARNQFRNISMGVGTGAGLSAAGLAAPVVLPAVNSALSLPAVFGSTTVPWLTGHNLLAAYGAYEGANQLTDSNSQTRQSLKKAYNDPTFGNITDAVLNTGLSGLGVAFSPGLMEGLGVGTKAILTLPSEAKNLYNTVATGESMLPVAWKSPAVGLSEEASQNMFKNILNNANLTDAERAVVADYQYNSRLYTGRNGNIDPVKRQAINDIIKKYNINVGNDAIATRMFNPENNSLGAILENRRLNFGDRPTSFTVGAKGSWGSGATDRLVIPNRYLKRMGDKFVKNTYEPLSEDALKLTPEGTREFAAGIGRDNTRLNQERELIGTGLDFKRIGKVKNDVGGYDWIVKPNSLKGYKPIETPRIDITKPIETPSVGNFDLEELRRVYHNSERFLQPEEARYLHKYGHGLRENYRTNMSNFGWGTDQWNLNNQLPPPPSEIQFMPDGSTRTIYNQQRIVPSPPGGLFGMTAEETEAVRRNFLQNDANWNNSNIYNSFKPKKAINKSGITKEEALAKASAKDKDIISKMSEEEFSNTVLKPTGEVVSYESQADLMPNYNAFAMSPKEYADRFNERLDLLNDIIAQRNKSGMQYIVKGIDEHGNLTFYTPEQTIPVKLTDKEKTNIEWFNNDPKDWLINKAGLKQKGNKWKMSEEAGGEEFDTIEEAIEFVKNEMESLIKPKTISGESTWTTGINPGEWRGNVEDIANTEYLKTIPGLEMRNTTGTVFADQIPRKGTGAYEAINEYLKRLDLGRVKSGFNSQTESSRGAWENFIKSGRAVGFYNNPRTVYGTMKTLAPYAIPTIIGAEGSTQQKKNGGNTNWLNKYK